MIQEQSKEMNSLMGFTKKKALLVVLVAILGIGGFFSVWHFVKTSRRNIILVVIDTLRADYLSCYGNERVKTPNIDKVAQEGVLFENCISPIPITLPAHLSIFYSIMPHEYEVYNNGDIIKIGYPPLAELLRKKGYQTAAIVSLGALHRRFGINTGFDHYDDKFDEARGRWYRRAEEITSAALKWLEEHRKKRFFLWLHYSDPHEPYPSSQMGNDFQVYLNGSLLQEVCLDTRETFKLILRLQPGKNTVKFVILPAEERWMELNTERDFPVSLKYIRTLPEEGIELKYTDTIVPSLNLRNPAYLELINKLPQEVECTLSFTGKIYWTAESVARLYAEEVEYVDKSFGRLLHYLKEQRMDENLVLILTSDHGEGLGEHNIMGHISQLYDSLLKVPLIIKAPSIKEKNKRMGELVGLMDISPTILSLLKLPQPEWMEGISLLPLISGTNPFPRETLYYSETFTPQAPETKFSVRSSRWKLIHTPSSDLWELYDLQEDDKELSNIFSPENLPLQVQFLHEKLTNEFKEIMDLEIYGLKKGLDSQTLRMLKSLGYTQ